MRKLSIDSPGAQTNAVLCLFRGHAPVQIHTQQACVSQLSSALQVERGTFAIRDPFQACLFAKTGSSLAFNLKRSKPEAVESVPAGQSWHSPELVTPATPWVTHVHGSLCQYKDAVDLGADRDQHL